MKYKYVCIRKHEIDKLLNNYKIIIKEYSNGLVIIKSDEEIISKAVIDVSNNKLYSDKFINNIIVTNYYIEGTDGVGKTSTIKLLIDSGIVVYDRDLEICKYMLFDISMKTRCNKYKKYLDKCDKKIIFLINNNQEELERRIFNREHISDFDRDAYKYNLLYLDTYKELESYDLYDKIKLVDVTDLSILEQYEKVRSCILGG